MRFTERISFLETAEEFLEGIGEVHPGRLPAIQPTALTANDEGPLAVVPAAP